MVPNKTVVRKVTRNVVIRTNNTEKIRITCILAVCADVDKLPPYIIFKGKNINALNTVKNNKYIMFNKTILNINSNAWSTVQ